MINYAIRKSVINNMRNPNSRLCYWHDTHFHIRIIFQTISVIILPPTTVKFHQQGAVSIRTPLLSISRIQSKMLFFGSSWCVRLTIVLWLKLLYCYCTSSRKVCSCEDCMWIRWRTWLNQFYNKYCCLLMHLTLSTYTGSKRV